MCLTKKQAEYIYKAIEEGNIINTKAVMYEIEQNQDDNSYKKIVLNKVYREEDKTPEKRNWSISVTMLDTYNMNKWPHKT